MNDAKIIVVAGPTASGKSDFAVALALEHNGEIISADSRQVYKGLDIGTGKITEEEMKGIPHHMLSVYELNDAVSVATYAARARPIILDIISRGKTPIICGGTGQYIDALIFNTELPQVPPNPTLRETLEKKDIEELFAELAAKDPYRADTVDRYNKVRLVRALEIVYEMGHVPALNIPTLVYDTKIYLLNPDRESLREKIQRRLEKRLNAGMIDEVRSIMQQGYSSLDMKKFGLEYESIGNYLEGNSTKENMKEDIVHKSMQYVKRQETWNKKYEKLPQTEIVKV